MVWDVLHGDLEYGSSSMTVPLRACDRACSLSGVATVQGGWTVTFTSPDRLLRTSGTPSSVAGTTNMCPLKEVSQQPGREEGKEEEGEEGEEGGTPDVWLRTPN